jgi:hypothetical protein
MKVAFFDLEWGQIYGSYRRHFIPIELGMVIVDLDAHLGTSVATDLGANPVLGAIEKPATIALPPILESRKFSPNLDIVIHRRVTDDQGVTTGRSQKVANVAQRQYYQPFDPTYRLSNADRKLANKTLGKTLYKLRHHAQSLIDQYVIEQLVCFGGNEDLNLFQRAKVDLGTIQILDLQQMIKTATDVRFSLDRLSFLIRFHADQQTFGSDHFCYSVPDRYRFLVRPHRAIGDACRIFLVYQEWHRDPVGLAQAWGDRLQPTCSSVMSE